MKVYLYMTAQQKLLFRLVRTPETFVKTYPYNKNAYLDVSVQQKRLFRRIRYTAETLM